MTARTLIFHKSFLWDRTFPWVLIFFNLWHLTLVYFWKTLILLKKFKSDDQIIHILHNYSFWSDLFVGFWFDLDIWLFFLKSYIYHNRILNISFNITHEHFLWQDFSTGIRMYVLMTLAIFAIRHYRRHLCFTNTSFFL